MDDEIARCQSMEFGRRCVGCAAPFLPSHPRPLREFDIRDDDEPIQTIARSEIPLFPPCIFGQSDAGELFFDLFFLCIGCIEEQKFEIGTWAFFRVKAMLYFEKAVFKRLCLKGVSKHL